MWVYLNGRWVPEKKAVISVYDHGFLYGDGVFETLRVYGGTPFALTLHLERLHRSASALGLNVPRVPWPALLRSLLQKNHLNNAMLRITLSRGPGPLRPTIRGCGKPTLVIFARPYRSHRERFYQKGLSAVLAATRRMPKEALDPAIKSANFLNLIFGRLEAEASQADEALFLNLRGHLTEASTANLFFASGRTLYTPAVSVGLLNGITRQVVLSLAHADGIRLVEGTFPASALRRAEEAFLTNSGWEIVPLTRVDGKPIGSGRPGPITRRLMRRYQERVRQDVRADSIARRNSVTLNGRSREGRPRR